MPDGLPVPQTLEIDGTSYGVAIAGDVACAWFDFYDTARGSGDDASMAEAQRVLGTTRQWPVLVEIDAAGDSGYPRMVWELADEVVAGAVPEAHEENLGC